MSGETCDWPDCSAPSLWRSHHQAWLCDEHDEATVHKYRWAAFSDDELRTIAVGLSEVLVRPDDTRGRLTAEIAAEHARRSAADEQPG